LGAAALAQQSGALEASFAQEEAQISSTRDKLNLITVVLIAWAVIMSAAIAILVSLVFTKLRSQTDDPLAHWTQDDGAESYVTDNDGEESSVGNPWEFSPNFVDLDVGHNEEEDGDDLPTGEGRTVEVNGAEDSDVEVERIEALFHEEDVNIGSRPSQQRQTNVRSALNNRKKTGGSKNRSALRGHSDGISSC